MIWALIAMAIFVSGKLKDISIITESLEPAGYTLMAVVKSIEFIFRKANLKKLVETLTELFPKTKEEQNIFKSRKYLTSYKRIERIFTTVIPFAGLNFFVMCFVRIALSMVKCLLTLDSHLIPTMTCLFGIFMNLVFTLTPILGPGFFSTHSSIY
jgi:hypothetical protein